MVVTPFILDLWSSRRGVRPLVSPVCLGPGGTSSPVKKTCVNTTDLALSTEQRFGQTLPRLVDPEKDIGALVGQFSHDLAVTAEEHVPEKSRVLRVRPHVPWYTEEISQAPSI